MIDAFDGCAWFFVVIFWGVEKQEYTFVLLYAHDFFLSCMDEKEHLVTLGLIWSFKV